MIGQRKIQNILTFLSIESLPNTLMLLGKYGSGRHTVVTAISNKLGLSVIDITKNLNYDYINLIYLNTVPTIYLIDIDQISLREQNVILKLLEEPVSSAYIILICENKNLVINTVINRCQIWEFEAYTKKELQKFSSDEFLLDFCETPGEVLLYATYDLKNMHNLIESILCNISKARFSNVLVLSEKLAYKPNESGYDYKFFTRLLRDYCEKCYIQTGDLLYMQAFMLTKQLINDSVNNVNRKWLYENYLLHLKMIMSKKSAIK